MKELVLGCGPIPNRWINTPLCNPNKFDDPTTCDMNSEHNPTVVWDLNILPWPWKDSTFDEVHAYNILEHLGQQGDYKSFFDHFTEIWRVLKPEGLLCGVTPDWNSRWLWGDPGHTRAITEDSLMFLDQEEYTKQYKKTALTDYRFYYKADFKKVPFSNNRLGNINNNADVFGFILEAIKSSRCTK